LAHKDDSGEVYYSNVLSGETTWSKPAGFVGDAEKQPVPVSSTPVPGCPDWAAVRTDDGRTYWHCESSGELSWTEPAAVAGARVRAHEAAAAAAAAARAVSAAAQGGSRQYPPPPPPSQADAEEEFDPTFTEEDLGGAEAAAAAAAAVAQAAAQAKAEAAAAKEAQAEAFRGLLREKGVSQHTRWEAVLPRLTADARFAAVPSHSARRAIFEAHVKSLAGAAKRGADGPLAFDALLARAGAAGAGREAAARKRKAEEAVAVARVRRSAAEALARENFQVLLAERVKSADASWEEEAGWLSGDERFAAAALDGGLRERLFAEHCAALARRGEADFGELLRASVRDDGEDGGSWEAAQAVLRGSPAFARCPAARRQPLWQAHVAGLLAARPPAGPP